MKKTNPVWVDGVFCHTMVEAFAEADVTSAPWKTRFRNAVYAKVCAFENAKGRMIVLSYSPPSPGREPMLRRKHVFGEPLLAIPHGRLP
jgi:hypothetical protein